VAIGRRNRGDGVDDAHQVFLTMLHEARQALDVALAARLGTIDVVAASARVADLEQRADTAEIHLRRLLLVHASVHGAGDVAACLTYMSIGKDAERMTDLALGLCRIAERVPPPPPVVDADLAELGGMVAAVLASIGQVVADEDEEGARALIRQARAAQQACSARLDDVLRGEAGEEVPADVGDGWSAWDVGVRSQPVALALTYRHLGRIAANALNIASSVVVPLDRLDYPSALE
jgi:phosphate uptake regulator